MEELNPEVVRIVGIGQAEGEASAGTDGILKPLFIDGIHVEGRIGQDEVEAAGGGVRVVVVAVHIPAVSDLSLKAMHSKIHPAQPTGIVSLLNTVNGQFRGGVLLVLRHEAGGLDEHAARAAGWIEDLPMEGLDDLGEKLDDAARGVEFTSTLPLGHGELSEEVLVDAPEGVVVDGGRDLRHLLEQSLEQGAREEVVALGENAGELRIGLLDVAHGLIHLRPDVLSLR